MKTFDLERFINDVELFTGKKGTKCGSGVKLYCPASDHRTPSLMVKHDENGDPWVHCFGGCAYHSIFAVMGYEVPSSRAPFNFGNDPSYLLETFSRERYLDSNYLEARWGCRVNIVDGRPALVYPTAIGIDRVKYLDKAGSKYRWLKSGARAHWFGLEQAKEHGGEVLYIVNGEVSVFACDYEKIPAVCAFGEATKLSSELLQELRGTGFSTFNIIYDRDKAGREGARKAVEILTKTGLNAVARELPSDLGDKADVDDLHRREGTNLGKALRSLPVLGSRKYRSGADIVQEEVEWFMHPFVPENMVTVFAGLPGAGKTNAALALCARETQEGRNVLFGSLEDSYARLIVPRAKLHGCDVSRLFPLEYEKYNEITALLTLNDIPEIEQAIIDLQPSLMVLDPLTHWIGHGTNLNSANEVRAKLSPLIRLAEKHKVTIILLHHLNKASNASPLSRLTGSMDIVALARSVVLFGESPANQNMMVLIKSNHAPTGRGITFKNNDRGFCWGAQIDTSGEELLASGVSPSEMKANKKAEIWLATELARGAQDAAFLADKWENETCHDKRTLRRVYTETFGGKPIHKGGGKAGRWIWPPTPKSKSLLATIRRCSLPNEIAPEQPNTLDHQEEGDLATPEDRMISFPTENNILETLSSNSVPFKEFDSTKVLPDISCVKEDTYANPVPSVSTLGEKQDQNPVPLTYHHDNEEDTSNFTPREDKFTKDSSSGEEDYFEV